MTYEIRIDEVGQRATRTRDRGRAERPGAGRWAARPMGRVVSIGVLLGLAACGGAGGGGEPTPPPAPDLSGARVMIVPARPGEPAGLDQELAGQLAGRGTATDWVAPEQVRRTVERTPGSGFNLGAPRQVVDVGGGDLRIPDPLYSDLRRLGAILDAGYALVPIGTRAQSDSLGVTVHLAAALVSIRVGRVLWSHTVRGGPAATAEAGAAAAAESLARTLIPY